MQIRISGRHFELTQALKEHISKRVERFKKYLDNIIDVHAILGVEKYRQYVEISVFGKRLKITEKSVETDMYAAIDKVCLRIEQTLRRYKDKVKTYRKKDVKKVLS
ncbi:MAG: ribosome-associated translation inhibitor RaiA [Candidatus Omnitrophota bacterium]